MTARLSTIYTSAWLAGPWAVGAVLRCTEHPDWEVDVDGTDLPHVVKQAEEHVNDDHKREGAWP